MTLKVSVWLVNRNWRIPNNIQVVILNLLPHISTIFLLELDVENVLVLKGTEDGNLTLKQAYQFIQKPYLLASWSSFPWDNNILPSHSMLAWRYMPNKIPTDKNLPLRGFSFPSMCSLCNAKQKKHPFTFSLNVILLKIFGIGCKKKIQCHPIYNLEVCFRGLVFQVVFLGQNYYYGLLVPLDLESLELAIFEDHSIN